MELYAGRINVYLHKQDLHNDEMLPLSGNVMLPFSLFPVVSCLDPLDEGPQDQAQKGGAPREESTLNLGRAGLVEEIRGLVMRAFPPSLFLWRGRCWLLLLGV